ncbi:MAG: hypothetical protein AABZ29_06755 [Gemmatimonadota bacterium]
MRNMIRGSRYLLAAFVVSVAPLGAQMPGPNDLPGYPSPLPALKLQPMRIAGEAAAGIVGFALGSHAGLFTAAGIAYVARGHGGDISGSLGLMRMAWTMIVVGGGAGAGTSAWLVSRIDNQTSSLGWDIGAATVATVLAFKWADWPMRPGKPRRTMSRFRRMAPVWGSALAATIAASATRERR